MTTLPRAFPFAGISDLALGLYPGNSEAPWRTNNQYVVGHRPPPYRGSAQRRKTVQRKGKEWLQERFCFLFSRRINAVRRVIYVGLPWFGGDFFFGALTLPEFATWVVSMLRVANVPEFATWAGSMLRVVNVPGIRYRAGSMLRVVNVPGIRYGPGPCCGWLTFPEFATGPGPCCGWLTSWDFVTVPGRISGALDVMGLRYGAGPHFAGP